MRQGCHRILQAGYDNNPPEHPPPGPKRRGRPKQSKARNLLARMRDHAGSVLAFMGDFAIPFDNNQSERDLRPAVIARKISCENKTLSGSRTWEILATEAATCAQRGESFMETLARASPPQGR